MYASSFILTFDRVETTLDRALSLETFRRSDHALVIAEEAIAAVEDAGELFSVALSQASVPGLERTDGDEAIATILTSRFEGGFGAEPDGDAVDRADRAGRVDRVGDEVLVPIGTEMPAVRNWWLLAELLTDRLDRLVDGFRRVHSRTTIDAPEPVETAFWTVTERLLALLDALSTAIAVGRYTCRTVRQGSAQLLDGVGQLATAVTGGENA